MSEQQTEAITSEWTSSIVPGMEAEPAESEPGAVLPPASPAPAPFDVVLRGYERHQVDRYLAGLGQQLDQLRADLAVAQERELGALQDVSRAKADLERGRPSFEALGERISQMLGLAEAEASSMREAAERDAFAQRNEAAEAAAALRSDAQRDADRTLASSRLELSELERRRSELLAQIAGMRDTMEKLLTVRAIDVSGADSVATDPPGDPASPIELGRREGQLATDDGG